MLYEREPCAEQNKTNCGNWSQSGRIMKDYVVQNALITLLHCYIHILIQNEKENLL